MRRCEIWTIAGGPDYAGKPRPAVIVQDNLFDATRSITVCPFTTNPTEAPIERPIIEPDDANGLRSRCCVMIDKITTVPRSKLGRQVGRLADRDVVRLNRSILVFLGLAG